MHWGNGRKFLWNENMQGKKGLSQNWGCKKRILHSFRMHQWNLSISPSQNDWKLKIREKKDEIKPLCISLSLLVFLHQETTVYRQRQTQNVKKKNFKYLLVEFKKFSGGIRKVFRKKENKPQGPKNITFSILFYDI